MRDRTRSRNLKVTIWRQHVVSENLVVNLEEAKCTKDFAVTVPKVLVEGFANDKADPRSYTSCLHSRDQGNFAAQRFPRSLCIKAVTLDYW